MNTAAGLDVDWKPSDAARTTCVERSLLVGVSIAKVQQANSSQMRG